MSPAPAIPPSRLAAPVIRIAILSDTTLFRCGLRSLLVTEPSFAVVAEATSPPVRDIMGSSSPHILLVDVRVESALTVCGELRQNGARPLVILVGADDDDAWAVHALRIGARGILAKSATVENLHKAVRVVHQGEVWASKRVVALTVEELVTHSPSTSEVQSQIQNRLSRREHEIAQLIARGLSNQEVADRLNITEATVKAHLTHIFQKLTLRGRGQLAALYHRSLSLLHRGGESQLG